MPNVQHPLDTPAAAAYIGVSAATLSTWRCTRVVTVPYIKIGRRVVYLRSDLDAFLAKNTAQ